MMTIPGDAILPIRVLSAEDALTANRSAYWRIDLLTNDEAPMGTLDGVDGGGLDWVIAPIRGRGTLDVTETVDANGAPVVIDWLNVRLRPVYVLNETTEWPWSVFIPSLPVLAVSGQAKSWQVELLEKACVLDQDKIDATYALDTGTNVIATVKALIVGAGEDAGAITDSAATLAAPKVWLTGTSKLTIINELLDAAAYFALFVSMDGQFRAEPQTTPASRPEAYAFLDDAHSIYAADFTRAQDIYGVPNKVVHISQATGTTAALTSVATNTDPASPYSYANRGNRWIVNEDAAAPVEATDQAALDTITRRDLINATSVTATVDFKHAPLPGIVLNAAVRLANAPAGIDARHVVQKTHLDIEGVGALALQTTTLREVVDL